MSAPRPNILFFLPDEHRPDWLGVNPELPLRTPHLDKLAAEGVRFTHAFCPSPLCAPSRACLASGLGYERCRVYDSDQDYPLDLPTHYQALRDAGYRVAGVGKFDLHKGSGDWGLDGSRSLSEWGFTEGIDNEGKMQGDRSYRANKRPMGPYFAFLEQRGLIEQYLSEHATRHEHIDAYTTALPDDAYCDNWIAENGLRFLRGFPQGQPWYLVVNFAGPHSPMDVTESMRARWENVAFSPPHDNTHPDREGLLRNHQNYAAMIENIDRHVGRFLEQVEARGELENTLIVYSSDHGEMLGDHGRWGKSVWYHPSVGIPLIVAGPGVARGRVSEALVSLHDLCATFLDYARAEPLPQLREGVRREGDARSLRPLLERRATAHREQVYSELNEWRMVFDGRYKLVTRKSQAPLLYDLREDPWEDRDLAEQRADVVGRLLQAMRREAVLV